MKVASYLAQHKHIEQVDYLGLESHPLHKLAKKYLFLVDSEFDDQYGEKVWSSVIPIDTQFREASRQGLPISLMNKSTRGSKAYLALLDYLLNPVQERHLKLVSS